MKASSSSYQRTAWHHRSWLVTPIYHVVHKQVDRILTQADNTPASADLPLRGQLEVAGDLKHSLAPH